MNYFIKDWILYQEVVNDGGSHPSDLKLANAKTDDPSLNSHVPFIIETEEGYLVKTGQAKYHPNDDEHYIIFLEINVDEKHIARYILEEGQTPEYEFKIPKGKRVTAYTFCNLHGLWKYELINN